MSHRPTLSCSDILPEEKGLQVLAEKHNLDNLHSQLKNSLEASEFNSRIWIYKEKTLVVDFHNNNNRYALDLNFEGDVIVASVLGRSASSKRALRNALIGKCEMKKSDGERHTLGSIGDVSGDAASICLQMLNFVQGELDTQAAHDTHGAPVLESNMNVFWWDAKPNFGDAIGPWLVSKIAQKNPVSGRGLALTSPPVMTVGSTLSWLEQDGTTIWGSGLMNPLSTEAVVRLKALSGISICAVRGKLTRAEIVNKLGWDVPTVYGDPALLLPRFLPVHKDEAELKETVIVPHYSHMKHFKAIGSGSVSVLDVQDGMESVVRKIASAAVCISTSLHGLIIAQAYGVPWVWVRLSDDRLGGDTFKFHDFFSTLDSSAVTALDVSTEDIGKLDLDAIAETACLPDLQISLDNLLSSFPHPSVYRSDCDHEHRVTSQSVEDEGVNDLLIANLLHKLETIAVELAEQRQLLERLGSRR